MAKEKSKPTALPTKRQTLLEENNSLRETIQALQDQNVNLTNINNETNIENSVLKERLSNYGLRDLCKQLGSIGLGAALGMLPNGQYLIAAIIAIISCILLLGFSVYDNFTTKNLRRKDRVGS